MVSIVIPDNSPSDLINAGLAIRHYENKGQKVTVHIVKEDDLSDFWTKIKDYLDKDCLLVILNLQLPSEEVLEKIDIVPYEIPMLYIPSELVVMTPKSKEILLNKGIAFMPQRHIYECFPSDERDEVTQQWVKINKVLSLEDTLEYASVDKIIAGFLKTANSNPYQAIDKVAKNDVSSLEEIGKTPIKKENRLHRMLDCKIEFAEKSDLISAAFPYILFDKGGPWIIMGKTKSVITTVAPSFTSWIFEKADIIPEKRVEFGRGAAIFINVTDKAKLCWIAGRHSQENIFIEFKKPKYVGERTLKRKLLGEIGYAGRTYRGVKDTYPSIEVKKGMIKTPKAALEDVISTLRETGTEYCIIE